MSANQDPGQFYICPMHRGVHQPNPGKCPLCRMDLLPEGTRFGMLRHMTGSPVMIIVMVVIMVAIMAMVMM